jgi:hypothetical protein
MAETGARIIKVPHQPQADVGSTEEHLEELAEVGIDGMPVVAAAPTVSCPR